MARSVPVPVFGLRRTGAPLNRGAQVSADRQPMDLETYVERARRGPCFVCAFLAGNPDCRHATVFEDAAHVAFLDRWPTVPGKVLVAPKAHVEHVVRGLDAEACIRL